MKLVALHLEYLRLQLVDQYLLPVQIVLQLLHSLDPFKGCVCRLSLFRNLSLVRLQQFLFFVLLGGNENLVLRDFLLKLTYLILRNDPLAIGLAPALLQLVDVRLQLHNDIAQLLVFVLELSLECLQSHLVYLCTLHLHLLKLRRIKSVPILKFGCAELNL